MKFVGVAADLMTTHEWVLPYQDETPFLMVRSPSIDRKKTFISLSYTSKDLLEIGVDGESGAVISVSIVLAQRQQARFLETVETCWAQPRSIGVSRNVTGAPTLLVEGAENSGYVEVFAQVKYEYSVDAIVAFWKNDLVETEISDGKFRWFVNSSSELFGFRVSSLSFSELQLFESTLRSSSPNGNMG